MESLFESFSRGGAVMWILLACSVIGVAIIAERGVVYLWYGLSPDRWLAGVLDLVRAGRLGDAMDRAKAGRHPVARVVEVYLANANRSAKVRADNLRRSGSLVLESVERRLRVLAALSHIAPLLGLLGTVIGMVVAFAQIQALEGAARPADLAGGIWEALLTTVFGLAIAIPAMAAFHFFESHADRIARRMEWAVTALDDLLAEDETARALVESAPPADAGRTANEDDWTSVA